MREIAPIINTYSRQFFILKQIFREINQTINELLVQFTISFGKLLDSIKTAKSSKGEKGEIISAAEKIRAAGIMEHPLVMNLKVGWNVGEVFNTIYLAHGGEFFKPGSAEASINNAKGVAALETMKALVEYAHEDHLTAGFGSEISSLLHGGLY